LDVKDSGSSKILADSENNKIGLKTSVRKVVDHLKASKSSQIGNIISGKYNYKGLFPYEMFVYLYNWKEVELRPSGLINCGNSCYANAVLQCLTFTPPLSAYLLQRLHSKTCEKNEWCFTCEFESLILKTKEGNSPLSPVRILSRIQNIGSSLSHGREEDAHEFLRYAVDTMKSVCLKEAGAKASSSLGEETTLIDLTFGGLLRSKIRCARCGVKSERDERMMDLTVEIEGDVRTLEEALRKFTGTEILDGVNKYQCSRCKSYEKARKKLTILEAPNVLTIALKRFQSGKYGKLNKSIQFPEILDLAPYMSETTDTSPIYRLYGVIVHLDISNAAFSGHYVCFVKNVQNKWFNIDDSMVKPVELDRVLLSKGAYMLLYARCSPHAPKSIRNSIIPQDTRKPKNPAYKSRPQRSGIDLYNDRPIIEDDSSSENSSSIFSESSSGDSCSTEASTRDSVTTDDYFDQIMGEFGKIFYGQSDSDTSSSSSYPSPPFSYSEGSKHNSSRCRADIYSGVAIRRSSTSKRRD
jgi:ubiquitin carboxyl-terminal hydrolase 36/42